MRRVVEVNVLEMMMVEVALIGVVFEPVFALNQATCAVPPARVRFSTTTKYFEKITADVAAVFSDPCRATLNCCTRW